jgi:N-acetylglucosaminyldiphosphoundecaprenol N-acetyl-beta-D-mannosaminyltransferase
MLRASNSSVTSSVVPKPRHPEAVHSLSIVGTAATEGKEHSTQRHAAKFSVLGVKVDAVQIPDVILQMCEWIAMADDRCDASRYITVTGMHGVMEAHHAARFRNVLDEADMVVPDGMPLVWISRIRGYSLRRRVYGPELMLSFCQETARSGYRHFIYGGDTGVPEALAARLQALCPGIRIVGTHSPPFRPLTAEEDAAAVDAINGVEPDVLWVGLGTPKQDRWMLEHRDLLRVPVMVGVGAAFDFLTSRKKQAPAWMQEHGLEWLFRLLQEPRRLWKRYLVDGPGFIFLAVLDLLGLRRFE